MRIAHDQALFESGHSMPFAIGGKLRGQNLAGMVEAA